MSVAGLGSIKRNLEQWLSKTFHAFQVNCAASDAVGVLHAGVIHQRQ